jgi:hypothetical protein
VLATAGGYESVAARVFTRAKVNHFLLEYDTPRAGDFKPLRFVPNDKGVVLGLVSTKTGRLEELDVLRRRTEEASEFIARERLAIGPQCGFASTAAGNAITEADEEKKLRLRRGRAGVVAGAGESRGPRLRRDLTRADYRGSHISTRRLGRPEAPLQQTRSLPSPRYARLAGDDTSSA